MGKLSIEEIIFRADIELDKFERKIVIMKKRMEEISEMKQLRTAIKNQKKFSENWDKVENKIESARNQINAFSKGHKTFGSVMAENEMLLRQFNKSGGKFQTRSARAAMAIRKFSTSLKGFRMEMLSVMFFGLGIKQLFQGILQPALELAGVFEIFGTTLQILFLPVALLILDVMLKIMDWFVKLPESVQMVIGIIAVVGVVLGTLLFITGLLALGLAGLTMAFGSIGGALAVFGVVFGGLIAVILIVVGIIALLYLIWTTNFLGMRDLFIEVWQGIVNIFLGVWSIIKGIWDVITGIFTGDWARVWKGVKEIFSGVWKVIVEGLGKILLEVLKFLIMLPIKLAKWAIEFIAFLVETVIWLWTHRSEWIPKVINALGELGIKMIEWAKDIGSKIWDAIMAKISALKDWGSDIINKVSGGKLGTPIKGQKQSGGYIPQTGLYKLHAGETVVPANQSFTSSPTINIYTSGGVDSFSLNQIQDIIARELASI